MGAKNFLLMVCRNILQNYSFLVNVMTQNFNL